MTADTPEDTSYLLKAGGMRKLADDHIWWSIFSRPIRSRFTRCQRVSVCFAMLYLSFLVNAMFYGTSPARVADPLFILGPLLFDFFDVRAVVLTFPFLCFCDIMQFDRK